MGEEIAAAFLARRGVVILGRNVEVASGEIDLIGQIGGLRVLIEVRTTTKWAHPDDLFPVQKLRQLRRLAVQAQCRRIDLVWVWLSGAGVCIRWIPELG
jgi:putative endonuclease